MQGYQSVFLFRSRSKSLATLPTQVIGICRFSYPAKGGFKINHASSLERANYLYSSRRLDERFAMFESLTIPSIRAQTDKDFTFLIVIGKDLPERRLLQLKKLTEDIPQVVIQPHAPGQHRKVMQAAINSIRNPGKFSIQFRNDDDDAINCEFVRKTRETTLKAAELIASNRHVAIDFVNGYTVRTSARGIQASPAQSLFLGVAFAVVFHPNVQLSIMNFAHHDIWRHMATITMSDANMWVRGINGHNDSGSSMDKRLPVLTGELERTFGREFGISSARVREIYRN